MIACVQRVSEASVAVGGERCAEIGRGLLILLGVAADDDTAAAERLADKIAGLRIFDDAEGKMNLALADVAGAVLVVSQFTLLGDAQGPAPQLCRGRDSRACRAALRTVRRAIARRWSAGRDRTVPTTHVRGPGERWASYPAA